MTRTQKLVTLLDAGGPVPGTAYSGDPLEGTSPLSVEFTDESTNSPTSWLWERSLDSAPGYSTFSTEQNPSVEFVTVGTYTIKSTPSNAFGPGSPLVKAGYIEVTEPE